MQEKNIKLVDGLKMIGYARLPRAAIQTLCYRYVARLGGNPDSPETHHSHQYQHFERLLDQLAVISEMGLLPSNLNSPTPLTAYSEQPEANNLGDSTCKNAQYEKASIEAGVVRDVSWFRPLPLIKFSSDKTLEFCVIGKIHGKNLFVENGWFGPYVNADHQTSEIKHAAIERAKEKALKISSGFLQEPTPTPAPQRPIN